MVNFMYIFEISLVEFIRNISVSKKHTLGRKETEGNYVKGHM